jgi:hypothetical protein
VGCGATDSGGFENIGQSARLMELLLAKRIRIDAGTYLLNMKYEFADVQSHTMCYHKHHDNCLEVLRCIMLQMSITKAVWFFIMGLFIEL